MRIIPDFVRHYWRVLNHSHDETDNRDSFRPFSRQEAPWLILLLIGSVLVYGRFLVKPIFSGADDIFYHLTCIYNFAASFKSGQWIPRTMVLPLQGYDLSPPLTDLPVFHYYGFLEGAAALPFMLLGFSCFHATMLSIVLGKWISCLILYYAARLLGSQPRVAFLCACSWMIAPYPVSCFYNRGALAEVWAHSVLPLILLGWAFVILRRYRPAVLTIAAAVFLLALAHNIFLLYGCFAIAILACVTGDLKMIAALGLGGLLGVLLSSWQWLPMWITLKQTSFQIPATASAPVILGDYSGVWGVSKSFVFPGTTEKSRYFFTVPWWDLPLVLLLIFVCRREFRRWSYSLLAAIIVFYLLVYAPIDIYPWLPPSFSIVQSSYRLLAILTVLCSFALPLVVKKIPWSLFAICLALMIASQNRVLWKNKGPVKRLLLTDDFISRRMIYLDYHPIPVWSPRLRHSDGKILIRNEIVFDADKNPGGRLQLKGENQSPDKSYLVYLASKSDPEQPLDPPQKAAFGPFVLNLSVDHLHGPLTLIAQEIPSTGSTPRPIRQILDNDLTYPLFVYRANLQSTPFDASVDGDEMDNLKTQGYQRLFRIKPGALSHHHPDANGNYHVELPLAQNSFWRVTQNGNVLRTSCNLDHRMVVETPDPTRPIQLDYTLSAWTWLLTALGLFGIWIAWKRIPARPSPLKTATTTARAGKEIPSVACR